MLFSLGLCLSIFYAIAWYYVVKFTSKGFLNVRNYLSLFLILLPCIVLIISVIKSSLALSLGLVGALSIIRFRTPIKEPIELMYFFVPIALGLSLGAEKYIISLIFFVFVSISLLAVSFFRGGVNRHSSFVIELTLPNENEVATANKIMDEMFCSYDLQRLNTTKDKVLLSYKISSINIGDEEKLINNIKNNIKGAEISLFNNSHIVS